MNDLIRRSIATEHRGLVAQLAIAAGCVSAATFVRHVLGFWVPSGVPYVSYFPVLLLATILGGLRAGVLSLFSAMMVGSVFFVEAPTQWPVPTSAWTGMGAFLISGGLIVWLSHVVVTSFRALDEAHRQERLLVLELQHRVKNTLSIVQAIASQTFTGAGEVGAFKATFADRLVALGRAHNVLSESAWRDVTIRALVGRAIEPFVSDGSDRIAVEGEDMLLGPALIVDLALCLHELGVNATKHGALSNEAGRVDVRWRRLPGGRVELVWSEADGPPVQAPSRQGFGTRLLNQGLSRRVRPKVATEYGEDGVRWTAQFDAS